MKWSALCPPPPHGAHWIGGCVGPRATLDIVKKRKIPCPLPGIEPYVIQPVASSLWQLGYSGSPPTNILFKYITYCKCRRYKFSYSIPLLQFSCVLLLRIVMPTEISLHRLQYCHLWGFDQQAWQIHCVLQPTDSPKGVQLKDQSHLSLSQWWRKLVAARQV
jgi:hypothetical protein